MQGNYERGAFGRKHRRKVVERRKVQTLPDDGEEMMESSQFLTKRKVWVFHIP
jgi:hypothetical protein